ncbi:MAG: PTS sugar transporter subunit IIA [Candidatus Adiutrix sp.]
MHIIDYLQQKHITTNFKADGKQKALESLCLLGAQNHDLEFSEILKVVSDRESLGSTGLEGGVALPHGRSLQVTKAHLVMAIAPQGVDFNSCDGGKTHVFVLMLTPLNGDNNEHLSLLAHLGRLFKGPDLVRQLIDANDAACVYELLKSGF